GSAEALAEDLERWLRGEPVGTRLPNLAVLVRWWLRQNFGAAGWTVVIGVVAGLLCGFSCWVVMLQPRLYPAAAAYPPLPPRGPPPVGGAWPRPGVGALGRSPAAALPPQRQGARARRARPAEERGRRRRRRHRHGLHRRRDHVYRQLRLGADHDDKRDPRRSR